MNLKLQFVLGLHFLLRFLAPFLVLFAMLFAKETSRKTTHYAQSPDIQRYRLPKVFRFLETPDEDSFPLYEPTVMKIYQRFGWRVCMWYNLGLRNQCQGLLWSFGKAVSKEFYVARKLARNGVSLHSADFDEYWDEVEEAGLASKTVNLFGLVVEFGWEVAHDHYRDYSDTGYFAIPDISFTK